MDDKKLNTQESLQIIEQAFTRSAKDLEEQSGKPLLIVGYLSVAVSTATYFASPFLGKYTHVVWSLSLSLCLLVAQLLGIKLRKYKPQGGFVDRFLWALWRGLGAGCALIGIFVGITIHQLDQGVALSTMLAILSTNASTGLLIMGLALRLRAYTWGSALGFIYVALWLLGLFPAEAHILTMAGFIFVQICLIGHYLVYKHRSEG